MNRLRLLKTKPTRVVAVAEDSVLDAIKSLRASGAAIVMVGDRLAGIFSERDYTPR